MKTFEEILQEANHLPLQQRLSLAHHLLASSEPGPTPEVEKAWEVVIRERIAFYDQKQTDTIPAHEVLAELDDRLHP